jgi:hypothetical protein
VRTVRGAPEIGTNGRVEPGGGAVVLETVGGIVVVGLVRVEFADDGSVAFVSAETERCACVVISFEVAGGPIGPLAPVELVVAPVELVAISVNASPNPTAPRETTKLL